MDLYKKKHHSKVRSLTRSIMRIFLPKKPNVTINNHHNEYFTTVYIQKNMADGIAMVANIERISKKAAAHLLLTRGFSTYMGEMVGDELHRQRIREEAHLRKTVSWFVQVLRKAAKKRGYDISKFI
jgi:hypothetical protein